MQTAGNLIETEMDGPVMIIRLADPKTRNSLTTELRSQLGDAVMVAQRDARVRAVLLTGKGPTFCAGGNLDNIKADSAPWAVHRRFRNLSHWLFPLIWLDRPVVVAVNGHAVGGGMGLALTGDLLVAGESAKLMAGFFRLGVVPDIGLMYNLPRLIGMARAKNFLFGNGTMTAREAEALGLVARVVPDDELQPTAMQEAQRLAAGPVDAMGLAKQIMARSFETSMLDMFAYEGLGQALAMASPEFNEGLGALMERRTPDFPGAARKP
jgi:2-(1,2-epoxy-1,2-dihydrophenyl)acetyl-CoA isomerase